MLERWEALEVVERREQGGVKFYLLRSYSFAQWLTFKALAP